MWSWRRPGGAVSATSAPVTATTMPMPMPVTSRHAPNDATVDVVAVAAIPRENQA